MGDGYRKQRQWNRHARRDEAIWSICRRSDAQYDQDRTFRKQRLWRTWWQENNGVMNKQSGLRKKRKGMDQRSTATARGETTFIIFIQKTLAHMRNKAKQTLSELNKG